MLHIIEGDLDITTTVVVTAPENNEPHSAVGSKQSLSSNIPSAEFDNIPLLKIPHLNQPNISGDLIAP
jgi:hypothetical protein